MSRRWVAQGGYFDDKKWNSKTMTFEKCERYPKQYLGTIHTLIIDGRLSFYNAEKIAREYFLKFKDQKVDMFALSKGDFKKCIDINDKSFSDAHHLIYLTY